MRQKYEEEAQRILQERGPLLGSELQTALVESAGVTSNNAKQIIRRLRTSGSLCSTEPIRFDHGQYLYYLPHQSLSTKLRSLMIHGPRARTFAAMMELGGFLVWDEFVKICGGVTDYSYADGHHPAAEDIYQEMRALGIVISVEFKGDRIIKARTDWTHMSEPTPTQMFQRLHDLEIGRTLLQDLMKWLERMNVAGWETSQLNDPLNPLDFNRYRWDAMAYSYIWGLTSRVEGDVKKKGSIILVEAVLTRKVQQFDIEGFAARVGVQYGRLRRTTSFRILPICFVSSIDPQVLKLARQYGIIVISLGEAFGNVIAGLIEKLRRLKADVQIEALQEILTAMQPTGQMDKLNNVRGYLFNVLVALIFTDNGDHPRMGRTYTGREGSCECDIVVRPEEEFMIVCETKGWHSKAVVPLGENKDERHSLKRFFEHTVKIVEEVKAVPILPIFVTSGQFSPEGLAYLEDWSNRRQTKRLLKRRRRKFPTQIYYDRQALKDFLGDEPEYTVHRNILKEFF